MSDEICIKSSDGPAKLTLKDFALPSNQSEGWYSFVAVLEANGLTVATRVHDLDPGRLVGLFSEMNSEWKGWKGTKSWSALEEELSLSCVSDKLGHAFVEVHLSWNGGSSDRWEVKVSLRLNASQYQQIHHSLYRVLAIDENAV